MQRLCKGKVHETYEGKEKVIIAQTSQIGATKLWRNFLQTVAKNFALTIDQCLTDYDESIVKPKKRKKRKKGFDREITRVKNNQYTD
jgi:hypothetical protein